MDFIVTVGLLILLALAVYNLIKQGKERNTLLIVSLVVIFTAVLSVKIFVTNEVISGLSMSIGLLLGSGAIVYFYKSKEEEM
jgi:CHASE2 domain-containing sensor protein